MQAVKTKLGGKATPAENPQVLEVAKTLPRIELCRCVDVSQRVEAKQRSLRTTLTSGPGRKDVWAAKEHENPFTVYSFAVTDELGTTWQVDKRFSEIKTFKKELITSGADIVKGWELPSVVALKKSQRKLAEETINKRKEMLETFLSLAVSFFGKHPVVKKFLASDASLVELAKHGYQPPTPTEVSFYDDDNDDTSGNGYMDSEKVEYQPLGVSSSMALGIDAEGATTQSEPVAANNEPSSVVGKHGRITATVIPTSPAELAVQEGDIVQVVNVTSAHWWRVRDGSDTEGFVSPKYLQILPDEVPASASAPAAQITPKLQPQPAVAPAAVASTQLVTPATFLAPTPTPGATKRKFLLMVAPNELVPVGRKLHPQAADLAGLADCICAELQLTQGAIVIAPPVPHGALPTPCVPHLCCTAVQQTDSWPACSPRTS
jgi:hypothetical protein